MIATAKKRVTLALLFIVLALGSPSGAHDQVAGVSVVAETTDVLIADLYVTGGPWYFVTARRAADSDIVHLSISRYSIRPVPDIGPVPQVVALRDLFEFDAPRDVLYISPGFGIATLNVWVPGVGMLDIRLNLIGVPPAPRYECQNYPWMYILAAPFGEVARADWVNYSGSIAGSPIQASFCRTYARDISTGFWYSSPTGF